MNPIYTIIEDGDETIINHIVPRDKTLLYNDIIKNMEYYIRGYTKMAKDKRNINICLWKLKVYYNLINKLEDIIGINNDTKKLKQLIISSERSIR